MCCSLEGCVGVWRMGLWGMRWNDFRSLAGYEMTIGGYGATRVKCKAYSGGISREAMDVLMV